MNTITNLFYVLSNALLIPVMILLLVSVVRVLILSGRMLQEFLARSRERAARESWERQLLSGELRPESIAAAGPLGIALARISAARGNLASLSYTLTQMEIEWQASLDRVRGLVKLGPSLGLMGTLIPLGPALVGLAVGDIQTMSNNLVIAFSTTVLGLFVGMVAGWLATTKRHWHQADLALLNLAADRLCETEEPAPAAEEEFAHA